jgi:hypothetical protein
MVDMIKEVVKGKHKKGEISETKGLQITDEELDQRNISVWYSFGQIYDKLEDFNLVKKP